MRVALGADHAGFELKRELRDLIESLGHSTEDLGTDSPESVDYPDFAAAVASRVSQGGADLGILVCGTGLGMAIAANKVDGVRAVTCADAYSASMARAHNDANVLTLGARVVGRGIAGDIVRTFLDTPFEDGRHRQRLDKIPNA